MQWADPAWLAGSSDFCTVLEAPLLMGPLLKIAAATAQGGVHGPFVEPRRGSHGLHFQTPGHFSWHLLLPEGLLGHGRFGLPN